MVFLSSHVTDRSMDESISYFLSWREWTELEPSLKGCLMPRNEGCVTAAAER